MARVKEILSLWLHILCAWLTGFFPCRKKIIVFCNYNGRGYGDNLSPIADEILKRRHDWDLVWLVNDKHIELPRSIRKVKRGWFREKACLSMAKVVISNTKGSFVYRKRYGSIYIQTWHGGDIPTKLCERSCESKLSAYYVMMSKRDSQITDYVLSGSSRLTRIFKEEFWYPESCKILEWGTPRKDIYFSKTHDEKVEIKKRLFGRSDVNVALYAPTFREKIPNEVCNFNVEDFRRAVAKRLGGEWIVVVRLHPNVANLSSMFIYNDQIINGTGFEDGQCLCLVSDLLVTDYSSIIEDFVVQNKPVLLFTPDFELYREFERPLRDFYLKLPFFRCSSERELLDVVSAFDLEAYQRKIKRFEAENCLMFDDGHASERVVDLIEKLLDSEKAI